VGGNIPRIGKNNHRDTHPVKKGMAMGQKTQRKPFLGEDAKARSHKRSFLCFFWSRRISVGVRPNVGCGEGKASRGGTEGSRFFAHIKWLLASRR